MILFVIRKFSSFKCISEKDSRLQDSRTQDIKKDIIITEDPHEDPITEDPQGNRLTKDPKEGGYH